ncbi:MAG: acyltransferase [Acetatifactor sp.]|nr:acyltransferase [Acetatifactor sp.]
MNKNREEWLDALRGFAMLLVIWGHCGKNQLFNAICLINVPLFICITGYINGIKFREREKITKEDYIKIIKHYVYPYLTYGILYEACSYVNGLIGLRLTGTMKDARLYSMALNFIQFEAGTVWFLIPLALAEFVYFIMLTSLNIIWKGKVKTIFKALFICLLSIGLMGMIGLLNPQRFFTQNSGVLIGCLKHLYYLIQRSFAFVFFLGLGSFCHSVIKDRILSNKKQAIIGCICLGVFCMKFESEIWAFAEIRWLSDYNQLRYFFMSSMLCFPLFLLFSHVSNHLSILQYIGRNTLIINGTHFTFNIVEIMKRWLRRCFVNLSSPFIITLLTMILTIIVELVIIVPIFNGSLRFMNDYDEIIAKIKFKKKG